MPAAFPAGGRLRPAHRCRGQSASGSGGSPVSYTHLNTIYVGNSVSAQLQVRPTSASNYATVTLTSSNEKAVSYTHLHRDIHDQAQRNAGEDGLDGVSIRITGGDITSLAGGKELHGQVEDVPEVDVYKRQGTF